MRSVVKRCHAERGTVRATAGRPHFIASLFPYTMYLLTAIGLSPGGSTHLHTNNTYNNTNNNRTTQIQINVEECGPCPVFASFTLAFAFTTEEKARKILSQDKKNPSQVKKNLSQSTVYILPKTTTHYKTHSYTHTHTHTHMHTHTTKQYKTTTVQIKTIYKLNIP